MPDKSIDQSLGEGVALLGQLFFDLKMPLVLLTLPLASFGLMVSIKAPELGIWVGVAIMAFDYAKTNTWAAVAGGILVVAALPLAWIALKEREVRFSKAILEWIITGLVLWFTLWLHSAWPYDASGWQFLTYALLLFTAWSGVIESSISTLAIILAHRATRPIRMEPPQQQPHGLSEPRAPRGEPETI